MLPIGTVPAALAAVSLGSGTAMFVQGGGKDSPGERIAGAGLFAGGVGQAIAAGVEHHAGAADPNLVKLGTAGKVAALASVALLVGGTGLAIGGIAIG